MDTKKFFEQQSAKGRPRFVMMNNADVLVEGGHYNGMLLSSIFVFDRVFVERLAQDRYVDEGIRQSAKMILDESRVMEDSVRSEIAKA